MGSMSFETIAFDQPIGTCDLSALANMGYMFYIAFAFGQLIGNWDASAVTNRGYMIYFASVSISWLAIGAILP